jgi:hypothetical protein
MAITVAQLHNKNFFSHIGTEYICTGFMFGAAQMGSSIEDQLSKEGFMPGIDVTHAEQTEAAKYGLTEVADLIAGAETEGAAAAAGISIGGNGMSSGGTGY